MTVPYDGGCPLKYTPEVIEKLADELLAWYDNPKNIMLNKFAIHKRMHRQRLSEFAEKNTRFADVYKLCKEWQELKLNEGGLTGEYKEGFSKFLLVNHHNYSDKVENKISGSSSDPFVTLIISSDNCTKDLVNDAGPN